MLTGGGTLTLGGANAYSGGTIINGGALVLGSASALGNGGVTLNAGYLHVNGWTTLPFLGGTGGVIDNTLFANAGNDKMLTVNQATASTFSGVIADGSTPGQTLGLMLTGGGTLNLGGANSYSGGTIINGGALVLGSAGALGNGGVTLNAGYLHVNGWTTLPFLGGTGGVIDNTLFANAGTDKMLTVNQATASTFSGVIADGSMPGNTLGLMLTGGGTLNLGGANTYSGGTIINGGALVLGMPAPWATAG